MSTPPAPLPIDPFLPDAVDAARGQGLVLVAEPGAGKTTRLPRALLESSIEGEILVLEPRRVAARLAALRVSEELGENVGGRVGYSVRFESVGGRNTQLRFVTHGVLLRRLLADPELRGVGAVVFDELHERHLALDLAFACVRRIREQRPLPIVAMSATLDPAPVAAFLGGAEVLSVPGRTHPVSVEYAGHDERPLERQVRAAVVRSLKSGDGDILVFLPGSAEIRRCRSELEKPCAAAKADLVRLHGDLSAAEQDAAVRGGSRRRVVLSTNVAESSVTVPGVTTVVDSGLARIARTAASGLPALVVERISQSSATQRAGRAGRVRPGHCVRLYSKADHDARPPLDAPDIARLDLCEHRLQLRVVADTSLPLLDPPPERAVESADRLLHQLGALHDGSLTARGRAMAKRPVHPRIARVLDEAHARGCGARSAWLAALLSERDVRRRGGRRDRVSNSDVLDRLFELEAAEAEGLRDRELEGRGFDPHAVRTVRRVAKRLRIGGSEETSDDDADLAIAVLAGFPDRVAKRRTQHGTRVVFAGGGDADLAEESVVREAPFLVATDVRDSRERGGRGRAIVWSATAIEPEWILELFEADVESVDQLRFDAQTEQVERASSLRFGGLVLDESVSRDVAGSEVADVLATAAEARGLEALFDVDALVAIERRIQFANAHGLGVAVDRSSALRQLCEGRRSFADLRSESLALTMLQAVGSERGLLDRIAPEFVSLPGRKKIPVQYEVDRAPWIQSRLQDFFGLEEGPRIARGQVPLVLHLLAPNRRAVQVTTDLKRFWTEHYPALRKQLSRRYPRHAWPEVPT